jgi:uncharacterized protein (TIGR03118 family)
MSVHLFIRQKGEVNRMRRNHLLYPAPFVLGGLLAVILTSSLAPYASAQLIQPINLVTDNPAFNPGLITDPSLVNAWGVSFSGSSPFWVSDNGTGVSTLYSVNPVTNVPVKQGLTVTIPGDGSVTGQAFANIAGNFNGDTFLFVSEDGTISGWRGALGTNAENLQLPSTNVYKGAALSNISGNGYLYAANFHTGAIDVLKGNPGAPNLAGNFTDPTLPSGFAPFNIQRIGSILYIAYAKQGAGKDEQAGPGLGFVSAFDLQGNFLGRIGSQGTLNAPWGLAIAPSNFGAFAGDLLVGNFGDGTINAFNLGTNSFVGQLLGLDGKPVRIDGLWTLSPGNGGNGGSLNSIYFTAGPNDEEHGVFGVLNVVPEPGSLALLMGSVLSCTWMWRRRIARKKQA